MSKTTIAIGAIMVLLVAGYFITSYQIWHGTQRPVRFTGTVKSVSFFSNRDGDLLINVTRNLDRRIVTESYVYPANDSTVRLCGGPRFLTFGNSFAVRRGSLEKCKSIAMEGSRAVLITDRSVDFAVGSDESRVQFEKQRDR